MMQKSSFRTLLRRNRIITEMLITLNKEYSEKGSPYAEYYTANNQVISQKMFGLHGLITPGKEETLNTNGGLMYYQYDGTNSVTELTNRNGDEIEHYRYDAFGNIYTGITSPYNTTGYTGQDYDDAAGLVQMDARWYDPNIGRFTSQDSYPGDIYTTQSLNRYSYVMNNPVNMWDPTGHVPEWVGKVHHFEVSDDYKTGDAYDLIRSYSSSSGWYLIGQTTTDSEINYLYQATITNTWEYCHRDLFDGEKITDPETGEEYIHFGGATISTEKYSSTDYYFKNEAKKAGDIAKENEQYIKNLAGNPPKNTNPPTRSPYTRQVGSWIVRELESDQVMIRKTWIETTGGQSLTKMSPVQSELNDIMNQDFKEKGWYGDDEKGAVANFQKAIQLKFLVY
jgi:RHS repeat-associated protein